MSGPHADELVPIELDQTRHLFFNIKTIRALDRVMGEIGIARALDLLRALNFQTLERVIWAGLLHEEPNLPLQSLSKRIDAYVDAGGDTTALFSAAYKALNGSRVFGPPESERGNEKPEAVAT